MGIDTSTFRMTTVWRGGVGLVSIAKHFVLDGYEVFTPLTDNTSCDLVVIKDGMTQRVECKSTQAESVNKKSWLVSIRQIRPNRTTNIIKHFDKTKSDLLAIYIIPEDRVVILRSSGVTVRSGLTIPKQAA